MSKPSKPLRIVVSGGGTGGHMIPGIALLQEFQRLVDDVEVLFLTPGTTLERAILNEHDVAHECVGITKSARGGIRGKVETALKLLKATRQARRILKDFQPDYTFGVGGIQSMPGLLASKSLRRPFALLEQNRIMGKANRFLTSMATKVFAHLPIHGAKAKHPKISVAGNPVRRSLGKYSTAQARVELGIHPTRRTLLVMGGSQGAKAINEFIIASFPLINERKEKLQVIHLAGTRNFEEVKAAYAGADFTYHLLPYGKEMGKLFAASDIVLARSGATTISELTMLGKPMILVPLPSSKEGDQQYNGDYVAKRGAALVVEQKRFAEPLLMRELLDSLILNDSQRDMMADSSSLLGKPRAGKDIALSILKELGIKVEAKRAESDRASRLDSRVRSRASKAA